MRLKYLLITIWCGAYSLLRCTASPMAGGVDLPDFKVTGVVVEENGKRAPDTRVQILPANYDPEKDPELPDSFTDTTDTSGVFRFYNLPQGAYTIQAVQITKRTRLLITDIVVGSDTVIVPTDTLKTPGAVKIVLPEPLDTTNGYIFIEGTTIAASLHNNDGFVLLDSVPAGRIPALYYGIKNDPSEPKKIKDSVTVMPAATASIIYGDWAYSRRLYLNTSATGANVAGMVIDFPILVRLNRNNITFSQVNSGGKDLRFTSSHGSFLPFEIERWDTTTGEAEIWVKIDTVSGNNDTQYIIMYWGNKQAAAPDNAEAVFDTSAAKGAFQGVWHLGEPGNTTAMDATENSYDGSPVKMSAASSVPGIIGKAQHFTGANYIEMPHTAKSRLNFPENGYYTLSAWVFVDTIDYLHHVIATKGHMQYYLKNKLDSWEFVEWKNNQGCQSTEDTKGAKAGEWFHIAGVRNGNSQLLFVNGSPVDSSAETIPFSYPTDQSQNFSLGSYLQYITAGDNQGYAGFLGKIDEVRVSGAPRSSDWIKLCYMNQKPVDALVVFR